LPFTMQSKRKILLRETHSRLKSNRYLKVTEKEVIVCTQKNKHAQIMK